MNRCIACGDIIPEGRQVCFLCDMRATEASRRKRVATQTEKRIMNFNDALDDALGRMCDDYCKYPEIYGRLYSDPDEAQERMCIEKCEDCPLVRLVERRFKDQ